MALFFVAFIKINLTLLFALILITTHNSSKYSSFYVSCKFGAKTKEFGGIVNKVKELM